VSNSLWPHESQHARPPCPSPTPGVHSNSCPSSRWCHPDISSIHLNKYRETQREQIKEPQMCLCCLSLAQNKHQLAVSWVPCVSSVGREGSTQKINPSSYIFFSLPVVAVFVDSIPLSTNSLLAHQLLHSLNFPLHVQKRVQHWIYQTWAKICLMITLLYLKSWLIGKDSDAGRDWGQEEKGMTEDEMSGWHHWLNGHESEWTQSWWWTGRADVLWFMGSQRVGHNWALELNWTEHVNYLKRVGTRVRPQ